MRHRIATATGTFQPTGGSRADAFRQSQLFQQPGTMSAPPPLGMANLQNTGMGNLRNLGQGALSPSSGGGMSYGSMFGQNRYDPTGQGGGNIFGGAGIGMQGGGGGFQGPQFGTPNFGTPTMQGGPSMLPPPQNFTGTSLGDFGSADWMQVGAGALTDLGNWWETRAERKQREKEFEDMQMDRDRRRTSMGQAWNRAVG